MTAEEWAESLIGVRDLEDDSREPWLVTLGGRAIDYYTTRAGALAHSQSLREGLVFSLSLVLQGCEAAASLHHQELAFVRALAANAADVDAACAYADYLEENGRHEAGARIRRLVPQSGDVLALTYDARSDIGFDARGNIGLLPPSTAFHALEKVGAAIKDRLDAHGREVTVLIYPDNQTLDVVDEDTMRRAGWVRRERVAEAVAEEREACADIAEGAEGYAERDGECWFPGERIAEAIRAREARDAADIGV